MDRVSNGFAFHAKVSLGFETSHWQKVFPADHAPSAGTGKKCSQLTLLFLLALAESATPPTLFLPLSTSHMKNQFDLDSVLIMKIETFIV